MKPAKFNNLSVEDAVVILELAPILDIAVAKRLEGGSERKFYIETMRGERQNLCIAPIAEYKWRKSSDLVYKHIASVGVIAPQMICEGHCSEGTLLYQLYTWLDGEDVLTALPRLSSTEQFELGVKFGEAARKLHTLPPLGNPEPWGILCKRRVEEAIRSYTEGPIKSRANDLLTKYLQDNTSLPDNRPQTFVHGDWATDNLILLPDGQIGIIDCGIPVKDPWFEFWSTVSESSHYCAGQVKGYFEDEPPAEYFPLLAFYVAMETLSWGYDAEKAITIFDDMRNPTPKWYLKDYVALK